MADDSPTPDLSIGLLSVALHITTVIQHQIHQCYQSYKENYYEYIDSNFDSSLNRVPIIGQHFSAELNNECYTSKDMMKQPNREDFEVAMHKEVKHMFDYQVRERVPRTEMLEYYRNLQRQGVDVKRKQLMLIW
eukprot:8134314-Ditylum_brightwellii.AAC.1